MKRGGRGRYILDYVPVGLLTRQDVADALGVWYHTVYMWERNGLVPSATMQAGNLTVSLYTKERVAELIREKKRTPVGAH